MGLTCFVVATIAKQTCCKEKEVYYIKKEEKKDDLDVYELNPNNYNNYNYNYNSQKPIYKVCPICEEQLSEEKLKEINNSLDKGVSKIKSLFNYFNSLVSDVTKVDIFADLESTYNEIEELMKDYDKRKFYKLTCEKKNQQCYINIYRYSKDELKNVTGLKINDERYMISNWKNDENIKKQLMEEREKRYDNYKLEQQIEKIRENIKRAKKEAMEEWVEITFKKEYNTYLKEVEYIDSMVRFYRSTDNEYSQFGTKNDLFLLIDTWKSFKYIGGKKKIAEYIAQYAKDDFEKQDFLRYAVPTMSEIEEIEYEIFEKPRIPEIVIVVDPTKK